MSQTYDRFERYRAAEKRVKVGSIFITRYEKARIIGARALQLSFGASTFIDIPSGMSDPMKIATFELTHNVLPLIIVRSLPGGKEQDIPISWLLIGD